MCNHCSRDDQGLEAIGEHKLLKVSWKGAAKQWIRVSPLLAGHENNYKYGRIVMTM
jgi:hypothetical protein